MVSSLCFACGVAVTSLVNRSECKVFSRTSTKPRALRARGRARVRCATETPDSPDPAEELAKMENERDIARMRARLAGLFGIMSASLTRDRDAVFDGAQLREAIQNKWGVQFDIQPTKRDGRVYLQIMWRYFGQQSFYLGEDDFAAHCEAVAQLLNTWDRVDYFLDWVANVKKRRTYHAFFALWFFCRKAFTKHCIL